MFDPVKTVGTVLVATGLILVAPASATEEEGCGVTATVQLESREAVDEAVRLVFDVRLDASCECASATYDLVLEELLPNQQWKAVRETRQVDVRGTQASDRVEHRMDADIELIGFSVKPVDSTPCG